MSCSACFSGYQHDGTPKGKMIKLNGLDTYVIEPTGRPVKGIIVVIPDAFGIDFVNNKILADNYAAKGDYKVYLPDFMLGRSPPSWLVTTLGSIMQPGNYIYKPYHVFWAIYGMIPWFYFNRIGRSWPIVKGFFEQLRKDEGSTLPIGAAGFCWGGKHTVILAQPGHDINGKPLIDAGFTGHPSMLDIPADIEKMVIPVSFALGADDQMVGPKIQQQIKDIVENKPEGQKGEVRVYEKAGHGFCVRADHSLADVAQQASDAEDQSVEWFNARFNIKK